MFLWLHLTYYLEVSGPRDCIQPPWKWPRMKNWWQTEATDDTNGSQRAPNNFQREVNSKVKVHQCQIACSVTVWVKMDLTSEEDTTVKSKSLKSKYVYWQSSWKKKLVKNKNINKSWLCSGATLLQTEYSQSEQGTTEFQVYQGIMCCPVSSVTDSHNLKYLKTQNKTSDSKAAFWAPI